MTENTILIPFGEGITVEHAEAALTRLAVPDAEILPAVFDFRVCRHIDASVGWRLGSALSLQARRHGITVVVPQLETAKDFGGDWFRAFTRSGLGLAIATRAKIILSGSNDVTELVRNYYGSRSRDSTTNFAAISHLTSPTSINVDDARLFIREFRHLASFVGIDADTAKGEHLSALTKLCFEAIQNVRDHADRYPFPHSTSVLSRFSLAYYKVLSRVAPWPGDFRGYVERTGAYRDGGSEKTGFVELVVCDDGVGIAARQTLDGNIFNRPLQEERRAFERALETGGSVKLLARDTAVRGDPGYGFTYITHSLSSLRAYAVLRSGRLLATFDGTLDAPAFELLPQEFGYLPGTALDIVFPRPSPQLRLPGM